MDSPVLSDKKKIGSKRNVVMQKNTVNTMNRSHEQRKEVLRKGSLENLTFIKHIEGKGARGRQRSTFLTGLCEWMAERGRDVLQRDRRW